MDRQTEIELIKQALALKACGETQYHESTHSHSTQRYISADWFERENQAIFQSRPIAIAAACELPLPGDYLTLDWVNGVPLLLNSGICQCMPSSQCAAVTDWRYRLPQAPGMSVSRLELFDRGQLAWRTGFRARV
jgi:hypothetical protein